MNRLIPIIVVALAIVAGGAWYLTQSGEEVATATQSQSDQPEMAADASGVVEMVLGSPDAPIELIEYASFTCPHCANFHEAVLKPLKSDYVDTGKVKVVFRDVYFRRTGLWAAMVARCGGPEKFWGMADLLMKGQQQWAGSGDPAIIMGELRKVGRLAGLTDEQLQVCTTDTDKATALTEWSEKNMNMHEITGTPSLIIDGEKHPNMSYADLKKVLDAKLGG
ncbi:DsbA family protein [uncultured Shimia sp.]|uniref:DsbA family protein n=1 Tax=uncultured Shimia sp. TaxID=573152 RepID=UPI0026019A86|nr:DsbA family protein [uncultured Shimia sp.]